MQPPGERVAGRAGGIVSGRVALVCGNGRQQLGAQRLGETPPRCGPGTIGGLGPVGAIGAVGTVGAVPRPTRLAGGTRVGWADSAAGAASADSTVAAVGRVGAGISAGISAVPRIIFSAVRAVGR